MTGLSAYSYSATGVNGLLASLRLLLGFSRLLLGLGSFWDGLLLVGLALLFTLWYYRISSRRALILHFMITGAWLALATVTLAVGAYGVFGLRLPLACGSGCPPTYTVVSAPVWGFWLAWIAVLGGWATLIMLIRTSRQTASAVETSTNYTGEATTIGAPLQSSMRWLAGASYSFGALLWGIAIIFLPWAITGGCPSLETALDYVNRTCITTDVFDGDYPFIRQGLAGVAYAATLEHALELILLTGLIGAIVIWSRRNAIIVNTLATVWLIEIALLTGIGIAGMRAMMATMPQLYFSQPADWKFGIGVYLAIIGIMLCACGVALRVFPWRSAKHRMQAGTSAVDATQAPG